MARINPRTGRITTWIAGLLILLAAPAHVHGMARVTGADGRSIQLKAPAEQIVTLAPHLTELVFAAGAGDKLVGVARFSNYPKAAEQLPRVGDAYRVDLERIVTMRPDLVLAWKSASADRAIERMRAMNVPVLVTETQNLADIADVMIKIGTLAGTESQARIAAHSFRAGIEALRARYAHKPAVRVFYQISAQPLFTPGGDHFLNEVIAVCGGINIFRNLDTLAPRVSAEAVLVRDPQIIIAGVSRQQQQVFARWQQWTDLSAVRNNLMVTLPADLLHRPTPRLLEGARLMCESIERARTGY